MLSQENRVQLAAMAVAVLVLVGFAAVLPPDPGPAWFAAFALVFYGVAFGGAHLYLYFSGGGDAVPRSARGRFLATLGVVVPLWAGAIFWQNATLLGVDAPVLLGGLSLVTFLAYFVNEMRHGYAESQTAAGSR